LATAVQQQDLFSLYFELVKDTEPPLLFHRWSLLTCLGAMLGRQTWLPFGAFRVFPNQYVMLIGESGTRKSTAIKISKKVLGAAGFDKFSGDKTSKEKFLMDLEGLEEQSDTKVNNVQVMENLFGSDLADAEPKEMFIVADEFNDFMRCGDMEFHSLLGKLWDWDDDTIPYKQRLKNSRSVAIFQPTISILGGNTHEGFSDMFPPTSIGQGILSRMLLVFSESSGKKIHRPPPLDEGKKATFVEHVQKIRTTVNGPMEVSKRADEVLHILYNTYEGFADVRFTSYFTRRYTHLLKLCVIVAAVRLKLRVDIEDVLLANTILNYTEHFMPKALGEFGKAKNADVANKILAMLQRSYKPVDQGDIWKQVSSDLERTEDLGKLLAGLQTAGKIQWVARTASGVQGWLIVRRALGNQQLYTDYSLLKEHEMVKL
jgi:hypothetical protein